MGHVRRPIPQGRIISQMTSHPVGVTRIHTSGSSISWAQRQSQHPTTHWQSAWKSRGTHWKLTAVGVLSITLGVGALALKRDEDVPPVTLTEAFKKAYEQGLEKSIAEVDNLPQDHFTVREIAITAVIMSPTLLIEELIKRLCMIVHPTLLIAMPLAEWYFCYSHEAPHLRVAVVAMHVVAALLPLHLGFALHLIWNIVALSTAVPNRAAARDGLRRLLEHSRGLGWLVEWYTRVNTVFFSSGMITHDGNVDIHHISAVGANTVVDARITRLNVLYNTPSDCPVCMESMFDNFSLVVMLPCLHVMHNDCYVDMIDNDGYRCPLCREPFRDAPPQEAREPDDIDLAMMAELIDALPAPLPVEEPPVLPAAAVRPAGGVRGQPVRDIPVQQHRINAGVVRNENPAPAPPQNGGGGNAGNPPPQPPPPGGGLPRVSNVQARLDPLGNPIPSDQMLEDRETRYLELLNWKYYRVPHLRPMHTFFGLFELPLSWMWPDRHTVNYQYYPDEGSWYQDGWDVVMLPEGLVHELSAFWHYRDHSKQEFEVSVTRCRRLMYNADIDPVYYDHVLRYATLYCFWSHSNRLSHSLARVQHDAYIRPSIWGPVLVGLGIGGLISYGIVKGYEFVKGAFTFAPTPTMPVYQVYTADSLALAW